MSDWRIRLSATEMMVASYAQGRGTSRGRIERLMRRHGIRAIMARPRRVRTTDSRHDLPIAPNLLDRSFSAIAPNQVWLADITYSETDQGWLYLAAVMDLYSRRIVGWAMADHLPPARAACHQRCSDPGKAALWAVFVAVGARGDCAFPDTRSFHAGDRAPAWSIRLDDLP